MNDFNEIAACLDGKLKKSCDDYDRYLIIALQNVDGSRQLKVQDIHQIHATVSNGILNNYKYDCDTLQNRCEPGRSSDLVERIKVGGLKEIADYLNYRHSLMTLKFEKHRRAVFKYTLLEWLSEYKLGSMKKAFASFTLKDFVQVENYLEDELKKCCDDYDKLLMTGIANCAGSSPLTLQQIRELHNSVGKQLEGRFQNSCEVLKKSCDNLADIVDNICPGNFIRIKQVKSHKQSLMLLQYEKHAGAVNKFTLSEWLL